MSLRALIEAKQRRTAKWPLLVGNPTAAAGDVESARRALQLYEEKLAGKDKPTAAEKKRTDKLRADLRAAVEAFGACTVEIELQSLPESEWEALFGEIEPDEHGDLDLGPIHAALLAASCTDPELQDADWWTEQLGKPTWTDGDKASLSGVLLQLNAFAPRFDALGKG